ncbi:MAG: hypothetical protein MK105_00260 [Crocinitomicaceae bacterium]|nr:hypothetical protein [Crocinitomicaceae bacterium]
MKIIISILFVFSYYFNFASDWIQRANFPASGRHRATGISIGNKGHMGLGHYNGAGFETIFSYWWEYDLATNSWTQINLKRLFEKLTQTVINQ